MGRRCRDEGREAVEGRGCGRDEEGQGAMLDGVEVAGRRNSGEQGILSHFLGNLDMY